jgi:MerR family transcriptional regulator, copper efflux regulator
MEALGIGQLAKRDGLATLIEACPGHGRAADCPILRALTEEDQT